jgi:CheY-like chemotaxis protein
LKQPTRPRIVCVDDDASIRRFVGLVLEDLPVEVMTCADAAAARELLRQGPVALLITDLMMPGESGFELLASLVADPALRGDALLAVFSAGLNATTRARLEGLDVWRELGKPVSVLALEDCVMQAVARAPGPRPMAAATVAPAPIPTPTPASESTAVFSDAERHAIHELFGGDAGLYGAFRDQALQQFVLDRQALAAALQAADWPAVHRQAHSLKGALATLGDAQGRALALALENAAAAPDIAACQQAWPALEQHLAGMKRA